MLGISAAMTDQYFVDSGCTRTIVCSTCTKYMKNLCEIPPLLVKGLSWYMIYNLAGDLHFQINNDNDIQRELIVKAALYYPAGDMNLIATDDLNATNWDVNFSLHSLRSCLFLYDNEASPTTHTAQVQLGTVGKLCTLPLGPQSDRDSCFHARCGAMSLEELIHECMAHAPIPKLALMSSQVDGLPHTLHFPKLLCVPCCLCDEAKAKRQPYPDASTTEIENEDDLMTWDLIDLGEKWTMIGGNRYILLFVIKKS
eukprot:3433280-Rhodomonas_salina.1